MIKTFFFEIDMRVNRQHLKKVVCFRITNQRLKHRHRDGAKNVIFRMNNLSKKKFERLDPDVTFGQIFLVYLGHSNQIKINVFFENIILWWSYL